MSGMTAAAVAAVVVEVAPFVVEVAPFVVAVAAVAAAMPLGSVLMTVHPERVRASPIHPRTVAWRDPAGLDDHGSDR
jgi:hypothetical protein